MSSSTATDTATDTVCARPTCGQRITLARSGNWVTGHDGWILPSHLNGTCDGIHLHIAPVHADRCTPEPTVDPLEGVTVHTVETGYAIVRRNGRKIGSLHRADFTGVWDARARNGSKVQLPSAPHYTRQCAVRALAKSFPPVS